MLNMCVCVVCAMFSKYVHAWVLLTDKINAINAYDERDASANTSLSFRSSGLMRSLLLSLWLWRMRVHGAIACQQSHSSGNGLCGTLKPFRCTTTPSPSYIIRNEHTHTHASVRSLQTVVIMCARSHAAALCCKVWCDEYVYVCVFNAECSNATLSSTVPYE